MRRYLLAMIGVVLLFLVVALGTAGGSPGTVTVDSTTDVSDGDTSSIGNLISDPGADEHISLREAIEAANNTSGSDSIVFSIPVTDTGYSALSGTWTITLTSTGLPSLTDGGTLINGTTQTDTNPYGPEIEITGVDLPVGLNTDYAPEIEDLDLDQPQGENCFTVESAGNLIHGLVINLCPIDGIRITGSSATGNTVSGNYIGTDATGTLALGNGIDGVRITDGAQSNVVGGDTEDERNVISGNVHDGIEMVSGGTNGNTVSGNYIGIDRTGTAGLGNGVNGIHVRGSGPENNVVGGGTPGERNVISGNDAAGVRIDGSDTTNNVVSGNYIGTDASGTAALGNSSVGVHVRLGAHSNTVGGDTEGERNVISGNSSDGVEFTGSGTDGNTVSGNYIGTDATGSQELGNLMNGVEVADGAQSNVVGGNTEGERNVISANGYDGVEIMDSGTDDNTVSGNYIGTDAAGNQALGNSLNGVQVRAGAQSNVIGGATAGERNVISGNGHDGVEIMGGATDDNTVSGNYIGTDATGALDRGNSYHGVNVRSGAQRTVIGGDTAGEGNVISGNGYAGVEIYGSGTDDNTVSGNYIGTDAAGNQALGNTMNGVQVKDGPQSNVVGGNTEGERNVISGNVEDGVSVTGGGTMNNTVSGNYIGIDATGTQDLGNGLVGVHVEYGAQSNVVGGDTEGERNVIAGNGSDGVEFKDSGTEGNTVSGNYIGIDATGTQDLGNGFHGVHVRDGAQNNTIGPDNRIAFNALDGVEIYQATTIGNTITENSIYSNDGLGIDNRLGGNTELPPPVISTAACIVISGTAPPNATIEIFTGPDDEGKTYVTTVSADGGGAWSVAGMFPLDAYVTATATDAGGNTSEFSLAEESLCEVLYLPLAMKDY